MPVMRNSYLMSLVLHLFGIGLVFALSYMSPRKVVLTTEPIHIRFPTQKSGAQGEGSKETSPPEKKVSSTPAPRRTPVSTPRATPAPPPPEKKVVTTPKPVPTQSPKPKTTPPPPRPTQAVPRKTPAPAVSTPRPEKSPAQTATPRNPEPRRSDPPPPATPRKPDPTREAPSSASAISPSGHSSAPGEALGLSGGLALPAYYAQQAIAAIASNFRVPESDQSEVYCLVAFNILADGTIESPRVLQSSGSVKLDSMAIEALHRTKRLAPLPDGIGSSKVEAKLTFSFLSN